MVPLWFAPYAVATRNCVTIGWFSSRRTERCSGRGNCCIARLDHYDIRGICFVGSLAVGTDVIYRRARTRKGLDGFSEFFCNLNDVYDVDDIVTV